MSALSSMLSLKSFSIHRPSIDSRWTVQRDYYYILNGLKSNMNAKIAPSLTAILKLIRQVYFQSTNNGTEIVSIFIRHHHITRFECSGSSLNWTALTRPVHKLWIWISVRHFGKLKNWCTSSGPSSPHRCEPIHALGYLFHTHVTNNNSNRFNHQFTLFVHICGARHTLSENSNSRTLEMGCWCRRSGCTMYTRWNQKIYWTEWTHNWRNLLWINAFVYGWHLCSGKTRRVHSFEFHFAAFNVGEINTSMRWCYFFYCSAKIIIFTIN